MVASDIPFAGQPYAAPRVEVHTDRKGRRLPAFKYPYDVLPIRRREDLELALAHYAHVPTMPNSLAERGQDAMRHLIEWIYPALRWYCRAYNEPVPQWLQDNGWADGLPKDEFAKLFGPKPLEPQEWREDPRHAGKRG